MSQCDVCGKQENMPYHCRHCGGTFCADHRLPENHDCPGLQNWNDPSGVFESDFDDSVDGGSGGSSASEGVAARLGIDTGPGSVLGYFRGNMTYVLLGGMWITFLLQNLVAIATIGEANLVRASIFSETYRALFILSGTHVEYVWTWFTSIFSHGDIFHIAFNSIWIFFFGRVVEDYVGSRDFTLLFFVSGAIAGLGQIAIQMIQGITAGGVLGASGAALAIAGVLTVLNPNLKVYIWGVLPVPIWALTAFFAAISVFGVIGVGTAISGSGVANAAHLFGLAIGLVYGQRVKKQIRTPSTLRFGGGGPGGPGGPGGRRRGPF